MDRSRAMNPSQLGFVPSNLYTKVHAGFLSSSGFNFEGWCISWTKRNRPVHCTPASTTENTTWLCNDLRGIFFGPVKLQSSSRGPNGFPTRIAFVYRGPHPKIKNMRDPIQMWATNHLYTIDGRLLHHFSKTIEQITSPTKMMVYISVNKDSRW